VAGCAARLALRTVNVALFVLPAYVAVMTDVLLDETMPAVAVKTADVLPAGTVTLAGTVATAVFPLESATTAPPEGAARVSVTVPVDVPPPETVDGFRVSDERAAAGAGLIVSAADFVTPA